MATKYPDEPNIAQTARRLDHLSALERDREKVAANLAQAVQQEYVKQSISIEDTLAQREKTHGSFAVHAEITQNLKQVLVNNTIENVLTPSQQEALDMICHKIGRIIAGNPNEPDHWHDIAGYATLVEKECRNRVGT